MTGYIDEPVIDHCYNGYESYGEICVHCGCCSDDLAERFQARLDLAKRLLTEKRRFNDWDYKYGWAKTQKKNVKADIVAFRDDVRRYRKKVKVCSTGR